ncbi:Ribose import ATP-binding protein RbsA [Phycisphaerae bacterium RAS2]|nr:Ribose import ATP-binding protein RbsA [Phycisphaerae bacterium RAS2]
MTDAPPLLRFVGVGKSFPGVRALDGVSFDARAGEIHAVVGENGAGKSTLMKILSGVHQPDDGRVEIDGRPVRLVDARAAQCLGIAIVHQEFNLARHLSVAENVFLGRWPRRAMTGLIDFPVLCRRACDLLSSLGIELDVSLPVEALSVARQQMVEIARALSLDARVLILDEPSAVLTPAELQSLFVLLRQLRARSVGILYISHRLEEIFDLADRVTVLRDGRHISTRPIADVTRDGLIHEMVGRTLDEEFPPRASRPGDFVLRVRDLTAPRRFEAVTFDVRAGEVFGLTGLVGSGRSSVMQAIFGACPVSCGSVAVGSSRGPFHSPRGAMAAGVAYLPEDRKRHGLLLDRPIRENVTLANLGAYTRGGLLNSSRERVSVARHARRLRFREEALESAARTFSGGNQQKLLLARWLDRTCRVMLLDEPTRGVDIGAKVEIYALINELAAQGLAVVIASSELPEVIGMCDRIGVLCRGRLAGVLDNARRDATQEQVMALAVGGGETVE